MREKGVPQQYRFRRKSQGSKSSGHNNSASHNQQ